MGAQRLLLGTSNSESFVERLIHLHCMPGSVKSLGDDGGDFQAKVKTKQRERGHAQKCVLGRGAMGREWGSGWKVMGGGGRSQRNFNGRNWTGRAEESNMKHGRLSVT